MLNRRAQIGLDCIHLYTVLLYCFVLTVLRPIICSSKYTNLLFCICTAVIIPIYLLFVLLQFTFKGIFVLSHNADGKFISYLLHFSLLSKRHKICQCILNSTFQGFLFKVSQKYPNSKKDECFEAGIRRLKTYLFANAYPP